MTAPTLTLETAEARRHRAADRERIARLAVDRETTGATLSEFVWSVLYLREAQRELAAVRERCARPTSPSSSPSQALMWRSDKLNEVIREVERITAGVNVGVEGVLSWLRDQPRAAGLPVERCAQGASDPTSEASARTKAIWDDGYDDAIADVLGELDSAGMPWARDHIEAKLLREASHPSVQMAKAHAEAVAIAEGAEYHAQYGGLLWARPAERLDQERVQDLDGWGGRCLQGSADADAVADARHAMIISALDAAKGDA